MAIHTQPWLYMYLPQPFQWRQFFSNIFGLFVATDTKDSKLALLTNKSELSCLMACMGRHLSMIVICQARTYTTSHCTNILASFSDPTKAFSLSGMTMEPGDKATKHLPVTAGGPCLLNTCSYPVGATLPRNHTFHSFRCIYDNV